MTNLHRGTERIGAVATAAALSLFHTLPSFDSPVVCARSAQRPPTPRHVLEEAPCILG